MNIRETTADDHDLVHALVEAAFGQKAEADLVDALRASGDAVIDLIVESGGRIVGHILLSKLQAPANCAALAPVSVAPDSQNQGIGSALIRDAIGRAKRAGWSAIFLLGDPAYYARFGFDVDKGARFETEYPAEYFMVLELEDAALDRLPGKVEYAAPFADLGED